jgi:hypothetical protein
MRILVAQIPMPQNRFLVDLNAEISKHCELAHSCDAFWNMEGDYDVIHLHFPEYLTFGLEAAYKQGLTDELIQQTAKRLEYWAQRAKLVVTRHVLLPHDALEDPMWEKMYAVFYRYADGVAHFAQASIVEFRKRYARSEWFRGREPIHAIIPHHNYTSLPDTIGREEARSKLGIPAKARVMLVFGAIRNEAEKQLILETFQNIKLPHKLLLVSRWRERLRKISWIRLKYWVRDWTRLYYRIHPSYHFNYGFVEEEDTQLYLNAADVLFIPRLWVLNSGNITLGMTFGKVVVGPDSWDVGELLRETGNPVFDPDRPETAAAAVEEGFRLAAEGKRGPGNRELALKEWSANQCAELYVDLYRRVVEGRN